MPRIAVVERYQIPDARRGDGLRPVRPDRTGRTPVLAAYARARGTTGGPGDGTGNRPGDHRTFARGLDHAVRRRPQVGGVGELCRANDRLDRVHCGSGHQRSAAAAGGRAVRRRLRQRHLAAAAHRPSRVRRGGRAAGGCPHRWHCARRLCLRAGDFRPDQNICSARGRCSTGRGAEPLSCRRARTGAGNRGAVGGAARHCSAMSTSPSLCLPPRSPTDADPFQGCSPHGASMSKPKVLIFAPREEPPESINALEGLGCELVFGDRDWQLPRTSCEDAVVEAARDAVALMGTSIRHTPISRRIMQASQRLRIVAKYTVGVDDVDTEAATDLGIMVCHAPTESNCFGVAETTITFMLSLLKKVAERDADVRAGKWRTQENFAYYVGSRASDGFPGQTIGLVGLGRIGTRVAQLLAPWRARIIAYDPYVPPAHFLTHGVAAVDYQTLLRESDVVSFHVVLTPETRYMFGEAELKLMKPNAIVLNTARGKVVDEKALARAIAEGRIRGAAIDAFEEEPLPVDSPLRKLGDRVLLCPHSASYTEGGELRQGVAWATRSVVTALKGGIPDNVYNRDVLPRWKERFGGASVTGA